MTFNSTCWRLHASVVMPFGTNPAADGSSLDGYCVDCHSVDCNSVDDKCVDGVPIQHWPINRTICIQNGSGVQSER